MPVDHKLSVVPKHIGVILDGNRRWAKQRNLNPWKGHEEGAKRLEEFIIWSKDRGVRELTLYTFSLDNFKRSELEVKFLKELFVKMLKETLKKKEESKEKGVRINYVGDLSLFGDQINKLAHDVMEETAENSDITVNFCMAYGGRTEIVHAVKSILAKGISAEEITEELLLSHCMLPSEPDMIIRTSGEQRLSNFLPYQGIYSELFFPKCLWPEFSEEIFDTLLEEFSQRKRRFGK